MSDSCPHCGEPVQPFDPSNIKIQEFKVRQNQEPEVTFLMSDWQNMVHDWIRLKMMAGEQVPDMAPSEAPPSHDPVPLPSPPPLKTESIDIDIRRLGDYDQGQLSSWIV